MLRFMHNASTPVLGFYSAWKTIGVAVIMPICGVLPLLPGFGDGLVYTAFFYTKIGYPFLVAASLGCVLLGILMIPFIFRALLHKPAIEISGDTVRVWRFKWREMPLACLTQGARFQFGNIFVRRRDGQRETIPLALFRNSGEVMEHLKASGLRLAQAA